MDRQVVEIEKLGDLKKAIKTFVRGVIKAKVFATTDGKVKFVVTKLGDNAIEMGVVSGTNYAEFAATVSTRAYNKVTPDLFTKMIEQFNKLKNFAGMTVSVVEE